MNNMNIKSLKTPSISIKPAMRMVKYFEDRGCNVTQPKGEYEMNLDDLKIIYRQVQEDNKMNYQKIYLHELLEGSIILLPKNHEVERNQDLENRCQNLKIAQDNVSYQRMTRHMDYNKQVTPEDTIAYQLKHLDKQLVAVIQFIFSVLAGFASGFYGASYILEGIQFESKLLLGVFCAFIIAIAEMYFLVKSVDRGISN